MSIAVNLGQSATVARYEVPDNELSIGSTLGGPRCACIIKANGALQTVYSTDLGINLFGTCILRFFDKATGMVLKQQRPGTFAIHPEHQEHTYTLSNGIEVHEDIFVLGGNSASKKPLIPPGVYVNVTLHNVSAHDHEIQTYSFVDLRGKTEEDIVADWDHRKRCFVAYNKSKPNQARVFGASELPKSFAIISDAGLVVAVRSLGELSGQTDAVGQPIAVMQHEHRLPRGKEVSWTYLLSFGESKDAAVDNYMACPDYESGLKQTKDYFDGVLKKAVVMTPSDIVNLGVLWAKANMVRTQCNSPTGWCFVNDPTRSNNSVARDTAWFAFGADYVNPQFARDSLMAFVRYQERDGLVPEYYDIRNGTTADYKLNINDNTPLLILALWHHFNTTGDVEFLKTIFPTVRKATKCILNEINDQGLVWCTATGTSDWGIVGWRNVISNYRLSGATTELNSECYGALTTASQMAGVLGLDADCTDLSRSAEELKAAINKHLINPENGLYYLSIDVNGVRRSDVTSDLVFPVMYNVADQRTSAAIISRLSAEDFWTLAGIRTNPRDAIDYDPSGLVDGPYGLMGGVWLGVSFWFAFAAAKFNQQFMAHALSASFRNFSVDPRRNNTVPGQFSEWLHGETLVNEGMMLSPWDAPRYLWAAVEGIGGLDLAGEKLKCEPRLAPEWKWLGIRNVPYRGRLLSWLVVRQQESTIYANFELDRNGNNCVYDEDITEKVSASVDTICLMAFRKNTEILIFVGSSAANTVMTSIRLQCDLEGPLNVRRYDSLLGYWSDDGTVAANQFKQGYVLQVERQGCALLQIETIDLHK